MSPHPNVETIRRMYAAFGSGDLPAVLGALSPDAVFHVGGSGPLSGDHNGHDAITNVLVQLVTITGSTISLDVGGIYADDHHGVVVLHETASRAADGKKLDVDEVNLMTFGPDGRIVDFWDIPEDHQSHDNFYDGR